MIREEIVSKRYADAFMDYIKDRAGIQKALEELRNIKKILYDFPEIQELLSAKVLSGSEKYALIDVIFGGAFSDETRNFVKLLIDNDRAGIILDILEYARVHYAHGAATDVLLKTSYPVETETLEKIKTALEKKFNKKIHLYIELDAELIGGISVKIGNLIIDGSVKRRLEDLRDKLSSVKVG